MGCFAVSCGISKLPINCGEKAGILLISKSKYSTLDAFESSCNLVSNSGSYGAFFALALPIFGYYDDYGCLENYIEDENFHVVKNIIEKHSYSFDEFMRDLYCGGAPLLGGMKVAGMFIHGTVYDTIVNENKGCTKSLDVTSDVLKKMGFHETDENTGDKRYKYMYRYKDTPIEMHSDKSWSHFMKDGKNIASTYNPLSVKQACKKHYDVDIDISMFETISKYEVAFDKLQKKLIELENINKEDILEEVKKEMNEELKEKYFEALMSISSYEIDNIYRESGLLLGDTTDYNTVKENYKEVIIDGSIKKQLSDWKKFYWFMFSTNTLIQPTMLGEQHGNYSASKLLYQIALKVTQEHIDSQEEDYEY